MLPLTHPLPSSFPPYPGADVDAMCAQPSMCTVARLAATSMAVAYKAKGFFSNGPTVAGCSMNGGKITVFFNKTMMAEGGADAITIQPYYKPPPSSPPISLSSSAAGQWQLPPSPTSSLAHLLLHTTPLIHFVFGELEVALYTMGLMLTCAITMSHHTN